MESPTPALNVPCSFSSLVISCYAGLSESIHSIFIDFPHFVTHQCALHMNRILIFSVTDVTLLRMRVSVMWCAFIEGSKGIFWTLELFRRRSMLINNHISPCHILIYCPFNNCIYNFGQHAYLLDWLRDGLSWDRISVGARFLPLLQTDRGARPVSCTVGTGVFLPSI